MSRKRIVVLGSGVASFREYALRSVATRADVVLVSKTAASWETPYCVEHIVADLDDADSVFGALEGVPADAVLTYDERYVELTARLVATYGVPGPTAAAVRAVKDKSVLRGLLAEAGVGPVRYAVAMTEQEASDAVADIGLPVVFKPRALGGSAGVRMVSDQAEVAGAFADAVGARVGQLASRYDGVLIEEYLDGPEISIDCVTHGGVTTALVVAEKETGLEPYFEEIGHVVPPTTPIPQEAVDLVVAAHAVAGLDDLVSHTEVRLTSRGPRIIELNARLGGDLIPYLGLLAHGVDLAGAAADIALGTAPDVSGGAQRAAAVRFCYPETDLRVDRVRLARPVAELPGLELFEPVAGGGVELLLPPRGYLSRLAVLVVTGDTAQDCLARAAEYAAEVAVDGTELASDVHV
ncbi:MAG TPA: ATP-grasp domain-containing protein [Jatrophihabitans sp.]|nr:ATP-grasp domain-containing protein [Jatrophihabitans sp.]